MNDATPHQTNPAAARGVVLLVIAIAVGVLLLRSSDGGNAVATQSGAAAEPGVTSPVASESTLPATPESTTPSPVDTSEATPTEGSVAPEGSDTSVAPDTTEGGPESVPSITGFVPRPASEVTVQVANTTTTKGAAGTLTDQLKTLNYITQTPTNLRGTSLEKTRVYYQSGSLLEAQAVAEVLGLDPKNDVFQMFEDHSAIDQWDDPDVFVGLGDDLAGG